jgi:hypothetical protein
MSTQQIRKRVEKIQDEVCPEHDGKRCTLEEFCRLLWQHDKQRYLEMADEDGCSLRALVPQFEREDSERLSSRGALTTDSEHTGYDRRHGTILS